MPRRNRYHPYNSNNRSSQNSSPRTPPSLAQVLYPASNVTEQPLALPYQYIPPGCIRGVTQDGKLLVTTSAYQSPDGIVHVQMQMVNLPSENVKSNSSTQPFGSASPPMLEYIDPTLSGLGLIQVQTPRKLSGSESSQDGRSIRSASEECAAITDDEDAEGEVDDMEAAKWRAVIEQRRIMADLVAQRNALNFGQ
jgi:hypothetical protein